MHSRWGDDHIRTWLCLSRPFLAAALDNLAPHFRQVEQFAKTGDGFALLTLYLIDATDRRLIDNDPARNDDQKTFTYRAFIA